MRVLRTVLFAAFAVLSTLAFSTVGVAGGVVRAPKGLFDWIHRNWSRSLLWAAGVRVEARGLERLRPDAVQIIVANHQSMFDIWALMAALPVSLRFVAKRELSRVPVFGGACRAAGHVFIDRKDPGRAIEEIREAGERMRREGLSLVLFAEGTRSSDGRLGPFKRGPFALAIETRATLIPVAVAGGAEVLPKGSRRLRRGTLHVRCGEPIPLAGLAPGDRDALLARTRDAVQGMLGEFRGAAAEMAD